MNQLSARTLLKLVSSIHRIKVLAVQADIAEVHAAQRLDRQRRHLRRSLNQFANHLRKSSTTVEV